MQKDCFLWKSSTDPIFGGILKVTDEKSRIRTKMWRIQNTVFSYSRETTATVKCIVVSYFLFSPFSQTSPRPWLLTNVFLFCCFQSSAAEASVDAAHSAWRHAARRDDTLLGRARPLLPTSPGGGRDRPLLPTHTRCEIAETRGPILADQ